ncbi:MAG TPA: peptidase, partial [Pseudonocardia sp.]|nr:peptidase [Pseudonocardia sp.]
MLVVLLLGALLGAAGWYFSSVLLRPNHHLQYPDRVTAVRDGEVWLGRTRWTEQPGEWGLRWPGGLAVVGPVLEA